MSSLGELMQRAPLARNHESLRKVLAGEPQYLMTAFTWSESQQGHSHWSTRQRGALPLSAEDRLYVLAILIRGSR